MQMQDSWELTPVNTFSSKWIKKVCLHWICILVFRFVSVETLVPTHV